MSHSTADSRPLVLIAVADAIARELIARMLHLAGFASVPAASGERALLELRERRQGIDWLVASDSLPGLVDATILADEFLSLHPARTPVLLGTSEGTGRSRAVAAAFSAAELVDVLTALVHENSPATVVDGAVLAPLAA